MEVLNDHSMEFWTAAVNHDGFVIPPPSPRLTVLAYPLWGSLTPCESPISMEYVVPSDSRANMAPSPSTGTLARIGSLEINRILDLGASRR